jgi:hypothetical protein
MKASGFLYLDDGNDLSSIEEQEYTTINYQAQSGKLTGSVSTAGYNPPSALATITILGVTSAPTQVFVNGQSFPFTYSSGKQSLVVSDLVLELTQNFSVTWD